VNASSSKRDFWSMRNRLEIYFDSIKNKAIKPLSKSTFDQWVKENCDGEGMVNRK
jgi:hypothetical protein